MKKGIDVSRWQSDIDWKKVKAAGIEFAIIQAGYGRELSQKDEKFEQNYSGCKSAGMPCGVYWYSYARTEAEAHGAHHAVQLLRGYVGEGELGAVGGLHHDDVTAAEAVLLKGVAQPVARRIQLSVSPARVVAGVYHGQPVGIAPHIAHEALNPCVMAFKNTLKL